MIMNMITLMIIILKLGLMILMKLMITLMILMITLIEYGIAKLFLHFSGSILNSPPLQEHPITDQGLVGNQLPPR